MARSRGQSRHMTDYIQNAGFGAWTCLVTGVCFISSGVRWTSPAPQLCSISSRVDRFDQDLPQRYLVHLDLQPVTFEQTHLVDFDTVVSTCQGRHCGHGDVGARARHQQVPTSWPKVDKVAPSKLVENHHEFNGVSSHIEYLVIGYAKELQRDD